MAVIPDLGTYEVQGDAAITRFWGFTREAISALFGGSVQRMIPTPAPGKEIDGITWYFCYKPAWSPFSSTTPGSHGLLMCETPSLSDAPLNGNGTPAFRWRGPNDWVYLGQYEYIQVRPWTATEWDLLDQDVSLAAMRHSLKIPRFADA